MQRKLIYAPRALIDLDAIQVWLTQPGSGPTANARLRSLRAAIKRLKQAPCLYPVLLHPGVRELPCQGGYRVLYDVRPDTGFNDSSGDIRILRVFGPGQSRERL